MGPQMRRCGDFTGDAAYRLASDSDEEVPWKGLPWMESLQRVLLPQVRVPGWGVLTGILLLYSASILICTYPAVLTANSRLAVGDISDPIQHIWLLRWYRSCLVEGTLPVFCPDLQAQTGSPLGLYTPLQFQTLIYLVNSLFTQNDILNYNIILFCEFLFTGFGSFVLAWYVTRHRAGSVLAGLLVMLSGPMMYNAQGGGTELVALGGFPLFLVGWLRFVDRPSPRRLFAAVGLFVLMAACAPYYGVMGIFPAVLYVGMEALKGGGRTSGPGAGRASLVRGVRVVDSADASSSVPGARLGRVERGFAGAVEGPVPSVSFDSLALHCALARQPVHQHGRAAVLAG